MGTFQNCTLFFPYAIALENEYGIEAGRGQQRERTGSSPLYDFRYSTKELPFFHPQVMCWDFISRGMGSVMLPSLISTSP
jgi:hypothetical protein